MKNSKINDAFENIDSKYIEKTSKPPKKRRRAIGIASAVALSAVIVGVLIPIFMTLQEPVITPTPVPTKTTEPMPTVYNPDYTPPEYPNAVFSVDDIVNKYDMIPGSYSATSSYKKIWYPEYLKHGPLSTKDTIDIFNICYKGIEYDNDEFDNFEKKYRSIIENYYGIKVEYDEKDYHSQYRDTSFRAHLEGGKLFGINQNKIYNSVSLRFDSPVLTIGDKSYSYSSTDEEVLSAVKKYSSEIMEFFDFQFTDIQVTRSSILEVRCYNKDSDFYLVDKGCSNYGFTLSCISFYFADDYTMVSYCDFRIDPNEYIKKTDSVRKLTLEEAHELVKNGYCFGAHTCPKCMRNNKPVDFTEYDYVGIEYLFAEDYFDTGEPMPVVPFYVFYKKIDGETLNGEQVYAKTWVPAIELSGLKEHFDNLLHR